MELAEQQLRRWYTAPWPSLSPIFFYRTCFTRYKPAWNIIPTRNVLQNARAIPTQDTNRHGSSTTFLGLSLYNFRSVSLILWRRLLFFLPVPVFFHCAGMAAVGNRVWGPYWYGTPWAIFFVVFIGFSVHLFRIGPLYTAVTFVTLASSGYLFPFLNKAYKFYHYYPSKPLIIGRIFKGEVDRYSIRTLSGKTLYRKTQEYWTKKQEGKHEEAKLPKELLYLPVELKAGAFLTQPVLNEIMANSSTEIFVPE